jgi:hypothetical protein
MLEEIVPMQSDTAVQATCPVFLHCVMLFQGANQAVCIS